MGSAPQQFAAHLSIGVKIGAKNKLELPIGSTTVSAQFERSRPGIVCAPAMPDASASLRKESASQRCDMALPKLPRHIRPPEDHIKGVKRARHDLKVARCAAAGQPLGVRDVLVMEKVQCPDAHPRGRAGWIGPRVAQAPRREKRRRCRAPWPDMSASRIRYCSDSISGGACRQCRCVSRCDHRASDR